VVDIALNQAVIAVVGMVATGVIGYLAGLLKRLTKREKARIIIDKASARAHVKEAYQRYVIEGHKMTIAAYEELTEEYEAYRILGGNGTAKAYMEEITAKVPYLVTD
jgi:hypothetical protein